MENKNLITNISNPFLDIINEHIDSIKSPITTPEINNTPPVINKPKKTISFVTIIRYIIIICIICLLIYLIMHLISKLPNNSNVIDDKKETDDDVSISSTLSSSNNTDNKNIKKKIKKKKDVICQQLNKNTDDLNQVHIYLKTLSLPLINNETKVEIESTGDQQDEVISKNSSNIDENEKPNQLDLNIEPNEVTQYQKPRGRPKKT